MDPWETIKRPRKRLSKTGGRVSIPWIQHVHFNLVCNMFGVLSQWGQMGSFEGQMKQFSKLTIAHPYNGYLVFALHKSKQI